MPTSSALQMAVSEQAPGTTVSMEILRDGKPQSLSIKLGEFHSTKEVAENSSSPEQKGKLGLAVNDLTADVRQQLSVPSNVQGVAVEQVRPASPAEDAGLQPGDVIVQVNRQPVQSAQNFVDQVHAARRARTCCCSCGRMATQPTASFIPSKATKAACKPPQPWKAGAPALLGGAGPAFST